MLNFQRASIVDQTVIVGYLALIFVVAYKSRRKSYHNSDRSYIEDQYLASKSLTFSDSLFSIIATEVSALTFLGIPAFAYTKDFTFVHIYIGAIFGRIIIARFFLPKVYDAGLTIFSVMSSGQKEQSGRKATALFYSLNKFLAVGVRLFSGSILIAEFFDTSIYLAVGLISLLTFVYTMVGGLKAVVKTDKLQMLLFIVGGLVAHYIIPQVDGRSWSDMMAVASSMNKTVIFSWDQLALFLTGVTGGVLFDMATHGVDQDFVQRLTANKSMKNAQRAIILSSFLSIVVGLLFLSIGALLWVFYQQNTAPNLGADKLFAYFITKHFPIGLKGLMVAGVLAATMSTLDSTINALSACFYNDILEHNLHSRKEVESSYRKDTFFITLGLMIIAFIASKSDSLLIFGLKITSWTAGSLVAIFMTTVLFRSKIRINFTWYHVVNTYILGASTVALNTFIFNWAWQWNVYLACALSMLYLFTIAKQRQAS